MLKRVRSHASHIITGYAIAAALVAAFFWFDSGQLRPVILALGGAWGAASLMWVGIGAVFAGLQCAVARSGDQDDDDIQPPRGGGGGHSREGRMIPIRVPARSRERR